MNRDQPAWSRSSQVLALPTVEPPGDFSPRWAFEGSTGRGVRVAVIDSGIEADHPLLGGAVDPDGGVAFNLDPSGRVLRTDGPHDDLYGHGTACAGIIHALAPEATITSVRVLDGGLRGRAAVFHAGLEWAVDQGFEIINLSLGAGHRDWALAFHDTCDRGYFANSFIVTAANNVRQESFPSLFASVTSVACNHSADPLRFHFNPEPPTEFLARGMNVEVPWRHGTTIVTSGNSFAAPHIAAFAALIKAKHPELRPFQIKTALWASSANVRSAPGHRTTVPGSTAPAPAPDDGTAPGPLGSRTGGAPSTPRPAVGDLPHLLSDYELGEELPPDPWGSRHRATRGGEQFLVRCLDGALAADPRIRARFGATIRIVASLRHPHLLPVLELREQGPLTVMVHPWCPSDLARHHRSAPLTAPAAVTAVRSVLAGLGAAHTAGVYHGDLRPDNVLIDRAGRLVVSDVGLAAALSSDIRTSAAPGDPQSWTYLAPEQLEGAPVGPYTDVHAAGLILFELLSGTLPYPPVASLGALVRQRARERPRSLDQLVNGLPDRLVAVVDRAVAERPTDRPATVGALAEELRAVSSAGPGRGVLASRHA